VQKAADGSKWSLKHGAGVVSDQADRLLAEFGFVVVDHRRQRADEIGGWHVGDEQDFGRVAGDMAGLRVAMSASPIRSKSSGTAICPAMNLSRRS
jgi:hypothetical protein